MSSKTAPTKSEQKSDVYEVITNKFIEAIDAGTNPFTQPWSSGAGGFPRNIMSRPYRGINLLITMFACQQNQWEVPIFLTYKQIKERDWKVRKGEKGTQICFVGTKVPEKYKDDPDSCPAEFRYFYRRMYVVFNIHQVEGADLEKYQPKEREFTPIESAESVVLNYTDKPSIKHDGVEAFYNRCDDTITMPEQRFFTSDEAYYEVLFHECAHSTGHSFRLSRKKSESKQDYAFEELVAELTSGFLCAHTGIEDACFERSAAYLADWLECLKNDKKFLLQAASMAQQATDYILGES